MTATAPKKPRTTPTRVPGDSQFHKLAWAQVQKEWERMSGQRISRARCWQICKAAERKIRAALTQEAS